MRNTNQKNAILQVLKNCCDHPTAEVVYERVRQDMPNVSLGTIYRNLRQFAEEGKVLTLETTDKKIHYDGQVAAHSHFLCRQCGKIIDVFEQSDVPDCLKTQGVAVDEQKTIYYGLCDECNAAKTH